MDTEDREEWLMVVTILLLVIVLPLLILEAPWLLALAMVLGAGYWWMTGRNPVSTTIDAVWSETADDPTRGTRSDPEADPLAVLRDRYARGEITEEEFERRLDRLLATEPDELSRDRERDRAYERRT